MVYRSSQNVTSCTGFKATLGTLDSIASHVPKDGPLIIVTASFEGTSSSQLPPPAYSRTLTPFLRCPAGEPADNAAHFFEWLQSLQGNELAGTRFAVFGCGNRYWVRTFQRVPRVVDELLAARGGTRLLARGVGDAQAADFFEAFDEWEAGLWEALAKVGFVLSTGWRVGC